MSPHDAELGLDVCLGIIALCCIAKAILAVLRP